MTNRVWAGIVFCTSVAIVLVLTGYSAGVDSGKQAAHDACAQRVGIFEEATVRALEITGEQLELMVQWMYRHEAVVRREASKIAEERTP
jgi:hypothetical protein